KVPSALACVKWKKKEPLEDHNSELPTRARSKPPAYLFRKLPCGNTSAWLRKKPARGMSLAGLSSGATALQLLRWRSRWLGLVGPPLRSRRHTRLSLHCGFVNHGALFQLSAAQVAFGDKVEVSGLALSAALTRRNPAGIGLVRPIRGQVVLDVNRALRTQRLHINGL